MFGLDNALASLSDGTTFLVVILVAVALGLRHATDPDHLTAVSTLVASGRERPRVLAARLGLVWGAGHAVSLFAFGLPIVLYRAYLPEPVQRATETSVGFLIVLLAVALLVRWHRGAFHPHAHTHARGRSGWQAFVIGLVHGAGGSAGVGVLLLATIRDHLLATAALGVFALFTALSMALLSTGVGATLGTDAARRSFHRIAPAIGALSLAFGAWYSLGAQGFIPYVL
jgi:high-affinity nickel permease